MNYVRCINHNAYVHLPSEAVNGALAELTIGAVYIDQPTTQPEGGARLLRAL